MDTKKLRQKILDLAIHGKLVPQDPNDEPASVLLERIRAEKERLIKEGKIKKKRASKKSASTADTPHYENEDMPFELPNGWEWCRLGEIGSWQSGATPSRSRKDYYGGNIPWLKTGDLNDDYIEYIPEHITEIALQETSVKLNPANSILIAMYGATIGKIGILKFPATTNQACCACEVNGIVNEKYLFYYLLSHRNKFIEIGTGGAQKNISKEKIINTYIPVPPLEEQKRIVKEIHRLFCLIDEIEQDKTSLNDLVEQAKSKVLDLAIHGKLVPQNPNDEPAIELLRKINPKFQPCDKEHYPFMIPSNWEFASIGDIFEHNTGKALNNSNTEGVLKPYITTSNLYWGYFELGDLKEMLFKESEIEKYSVQKNDLLICEGGDIGRSAIWEKEDSILIQNHIHKLRAKEKICVRFYYYVIMYYKRYNLLSGKGIAIQGLSSRALHNLQIPIPPINEQFRISSKIDVLFNQLDLISQCLAD